MILLTRKADFSSAHFYWNDAVESEEENVRVFGKCANRQGHGHNYTLEVTVAGEYRSRHLVLSSISKQLKDIMEREVVSVYDHRHLNHEVPEFKSVGTDYGEHRHRHLAAISTGKSPTRKLHRVRVYEMPDALC